MTTNVARFNNVQPSVTDTVTPVSEITASPSSSEKEHCSGGTNDTMHGRSRRLRTINLNLGLDVLGMITCSSGVVANEPDVPVAAGEVGSLPLTDLINRCIS